MNNYINEVDVIKYIEYDELKKYANESAPGKRLITIKNSKIYNYTCKENNESDPAWTEVANLDCDYLIDGRLISISSRIDINELLCQLAEENSELTQACLKHRRAKLALTPKTQNQTLENLAEEMADVSILMDPLIYMMKDDKLKEKIDIIKERKIDRYFRRTFIGIYEE